MQQDCYILDNYLQFKWIIRCIVSSVLVYVLNFYRQVSYTKHNRPLGQHNTEKVFRQNTNGRFQDGELTLFPGVTNYLY